MSKLTLKEVLESIGVKNVPTSATFNKYEPKDFQIEGARQSLIHVNYGLFDQTGVGKTMTIFLTLLAWYYQGNKVALITKPGLFAQVKQDWEDIFSDLEVAPSEKLGSDIALMTHQCFVVKRYRDAIMSEYFVLVIDEFHKIRNAEKRRFKTLLAMTKRTPMSVMVATGTPITKDLRDSYACIKLIYPKAYKDFKSFCRTHVKYRHIRTGQGTRPLVDGFKNEETLRKRLIVHGRRLLKKDVWEDLEEPIISKRYLYLTDTQKSVYEEFQEFLIYENTEGCLFDASYSPTLKFSKGIQSVTFPAKFEKDAVSCVLNDIKSIAEEVTVSNKLMVFVLYEETALHYAKELAEFNPALITGALKEDVKFKEDDACRLCVATLGAGAEGFSFQKVCSYLYLAEYLPVPGLLEQAANRIYRPNQINAPTIYIPHVVNTLYVTSLITKSNERHDSNKKVMPTDFNLK